MEVVHVSEICWNFDISYLAIKDIIIPVIIIVVIIIIITIIIIDWTGNRSFWSYSLPTQAQITCWSVPLAPAIAIPKINVLAETLVGIYEMMKHQKKKYIILLSFF